MPATASGPEHGFVFAQDVNALPIVGSAGLFPVRRIYCVGRNYLEHIREMKEADQRDPPFFPIGVISAMPPRGASPACAVTARRRPASSSGARPRRRIWWSRGDQIARMEARHQITEAQFAAGRHYQPLHEIAFDSACARPSRSPGDRCPACAVDPFQ